MPPNEHQIVRLIVYSEPVYAFLDSGVTPNAISARLELKLTPAERRIMANGARDGVSGMVTNVPVGFGKMVTA